MRKVDLQCVVAVDASCAVVVFHAGVCVVERDVHVGPLLAVCKLDEVLVACADAMAARLHCRQPRIELGGSLCELNWHPPFLQ